MPFTNTHANNILDWAFGKKALSAFTTVYIGLCSNNPEETGGTITELSGGGYSRVLIAQYNQTYPNLMNSAAVRSIINGKQINWTKATQDWAKVNGFFLSSSATVGETSSVFFYGALELTEEQKAAGGLLVEAGAVALFDPEAFKIEFPEQDIAVSGIDGTILYAVKTLGTFAHNSNYGYHSCAVVPAQFTITVGKTYKVVWDGEEHTCVAQDSSSVMPGSVLIGNGSALGLAGVAPFAIVHTTDNAITFFATNTNSTHSVVVYDLND